jgi:hypothetical protein
LKASNRKQAFELSQDHPPPEPWRLGFFMKTTSWHAKSCSAAIDWILNKPRLLRIPLIKWF